MAAKEIQIREGLTFETQRGSKIVIKNVTIWVKGHRLMDTLISYTLNDRNRSGGAEYFARDMEEL